MGLYGDVVPCSWEETKKHADDVRRRAVTQFLRLYKEQPFRSNDPALWGDELEYQLVELNAGDRKARLRLDSLAVLDRLRMLDASHVIALEGTLGTEHPGLWGPEGVPSLVESVPDVPFGPQLSHVTRIEANMAARRRALHSVLDPGVVGLTLAVFPRFGSPDFTVPSQRVLASPSPWQSAFVSSAFQDIAHQRPRIMSRNLSQRYEDVKVINIPVYQDEQTCTEDLAMLGDGGLRQRHSIPGHVILDSALFGASLASLHVTQQAANESEARRLFDLLAPLAPLMMALTAACPIHRGRLVDTDSRWVVLTQAYDDRCPQERDQGSPAYRSRRRFDNITCYISPEHQACNDVTGGCREEVFSALTKGGVDAVLSRHMAEVLSRDPLYLLQPPPGAEEDNCQDFLILLTTSWETVRLKPPYGDAGWRVEFRPMDVQLTEVENAAMVSFLVLVSRALLHFRLSLAIPVSKLDDNMREAVSRDAVTHARFHFSCRPLPGLQRYSEGQAPQDVHTELMSVNDVINGNAKFEGLVPIIRRYVDGQNADNATREAISRHLSLVSSRASGKTPTMAAWIRRFVTSHPEYRKDSLVSDSITFDLLTRCSKLAAGKITDPNLFPGEKRERETEQ